VFGIALIALAAVIAGKAFDVHDEPTKGTKVVSVTRTYAKPKGGKKPRIVRGTKRVDNTPSESGGRPEWLVSAAFGIALFLALAGAFVDRERLAFGLGKYGSVTVGPPPEAAAQAAASKTPEEATQATAALISAQTVDLAQRGVPLNEAATIAADAAKKKMPASPGVAEIAHATTEKVPDDLAPERVALVTAKAAELANTGAPVDKAAARAVEEVLTEVERS
jgi:hypothetical protein